MGATSWRDPQHRSWSGMIVQPVGGEAWRHARTRLAFDTDPIGLVIRARGDRVVALQMTGSRHVQRECKILARAVAHHALSVLRRQHEGTDHLAFGFRALHRELAPAVPAARSGSETAIDAGLARH